MQEIDRALAQWVTGEIDDDTALKLICARLQQRDVSCGIVQKGDKGVALVSTDDASIDSNLFVRVASYCAPNRALYTASDECWATLLEASTGERRDDVAWIACEPVADPTGPWAMLVVIGRSEASRNDVLATLPGLARACFPILARARARVAMPKLKHQIFGLLTAIVGNLEYAGLLLESEHAQEPAPTQLAALRRAVHNAGESAKQLSVQIDVIASVSGRAGSR